MAPTQDSRALEFSHVLDLSGMTEIATSAHLRAERRECAAISARLGLEDIRALEADITVRNGPVKDVFLVSGNLRAEVVQECVVTLQPVDMIVESDFETVYARNGAEVEAMGECGDDTDPPELIIEDRIDLGEEVVQQLACALDPYPRSAGAEVDPRWIADAEDSTKSGPFVALEGLRRKNDDR
ncbi:MAG: DUF177 domain-containing protein [Alphaproteobacteria bacterium]|nr:DUF177 domain-containing protein [Alphaproteobacteria bacterium]